MLKIEQINHYLGFGDGNKRGECYLSQGMRSIRRGLEPGWKIVQHYTDSTSIANHFAERPDGKVYAVMSDGNIRQGVGWAVVKVNTQTSDGNGMIVDQKGRLLYMSRQYMGMYEGGAWTDNWKDLGDSLVNYPRVATLYEDWVVTVGSTAGSAHGNTVALLSVADDSFNAEAFTLPDNFDIKGLESGQYGVLIGANVTGTGKGVLILYDCKAIDAPDKTFFPWIWLDKEIKSIKKWNGIWIVSTGNEFLITNGYRIIDRFPVFDDKIDDYPFGPSYPEGMRTKGNSLFVAGRPKAVGNTSVYNRKRQGLYIFDLMTRLWEFCPISTNLLIDTAYIQTLFIDSANIFWLSYRDTVSGDYHIGKLQEKVPATSFFITQPMGKGNRNKKAEGIVFDLSFDLQNYLVKHGKNPDWTITVKLFNFKRQLWGYALPNGDASDKGEIEVAGATDHDYNKAAVGDEVTILYAINADNQGEIRHITAIANPETNTEVWTLDSDLPELSKIGDIISVCPFKKVGEKTITDWEIIDNRLFIPIKKSIKGRKFMMKVVVEVGNDAEMSPHFGDSWFVYKELGY